MKFEHFFRVATPLPVILLAISHLIPIPPSLLLIQFTLNLVVIPYILFSVLLIYFSFKLRAITLKIIASLAPVIFMPFSLIGLYVAGDYSLEGGLGVAGVYYTFFFGYIYTETFARTHCRVSQFSKRAFF